jgi:sporulation and spore germination protein/immunoglobulin-like protein involved in spore germination
VRTHVAASVALATLALAACTINTIPPNATDPTQEPTTEGMAAYFLLDSEFGGPFLVPVWDADASTLEDAMAALLAGPEEVLAGTAFDRTGLSSALPVGTTLHSASVDGSTAVVDLSSTFDDGGGSAGMQARLAQVVYTATQSEGVEDVELRIEGEVVEVFSNEGITLSQPLTRFDALATGIVGKLFIDRPAYGQTVAPTFAMTGYARDLFEATFHYTLTDGGLHTYAESPVTATGSQGWNGYAQAVETGLSSPTVGELRVFEASMEDGSALFELAYPIAIDPAA